MSIIWDADLSLAAMGLLICLSTVKDDHGNISVEECFSLKELTEWWPNFNIPSLLEELSRAGYAEFRGGDWSVSDQKTLKVKVEGNSAN